MLAWHKQGGVAKPYAVSWCRFINAAGGLGISCQNDSYKVFVSHSSQSGLRSEYPDAALRYNPEITAKETSCRLACSV